MTDMEIAKKYLIEEDLTIIAVKNKEIVFKSKKRGISPMYQLGKEKKDLVKDGALADKVIGKGAALLCKYMGIKEVYGELISESAMEVLEKENIKFTYLKSTEYIKNKAQTNLCPIENLAMDINDGEIMLEKIGEFLDKVSS